MKIKVFCTSKDTIKIMDTWAIVKKNYSQLINLTKDSYLQIIYIYNQHKRLLPLIPLPLSKSSFCG